MGRRDLSRDLGRVWRRAALMWRLRLYARILLCLMAVPAHAQTRVVDGDTIHVDGERIRIFGLDCPEKRDPGGREATRAMQRLVEGATLAFQRIEKDRYQRTVAKVFANGRDVTREMIRLGVCSEYCRYSKNAYGTCR